jgi:hypothetical protein
MASGDFPPFAFVCVQRPAHCVHHDTASKEKQKGCVAEATSKTKKSPFHEA